MSVPLKDELKEIRKTLDKLDQHRLVKIYNSVWRLLWFQFLRGMAFGLGSVIGATLVVSILISLLSQIEFIPIIGEWAKELIIEIKSDLAQGADTTDEP